MPNVVITNNSTTKAFQYNVCGKYETRTLEPNSSVTLPIGAIAWYTSAEQKAYYEALDGSMDGGISVTYDADTDVNGISFTIKNAIGGAAISGATITYAEGLTLTTNASGVASVSSLEPGTYNISVAKTGYQTLTATVVIAAGVTGSVICDFAMLTDAQTNNMSFHVTSAETAANIEGATITYGEGLTLTTAANGTASVASLAAGTYNITIAKDTYTSFTGSVTFAAGLLGSYVAEVALVAAG